MGSSNSDLRTAGGTYLGYKDNCKQAFNISVCTNSIILTEDSDSLAGGVNVKLSQSCGGTDPGTYACIENQCKQYRGDKELSECLDTCGVVPPSNTYGCVKGVCMGQGINTLADCKTVCMP
jgi:hypothetical protein